jgi:uncharacterized tellurite resistance protein B-like protein
MLERLKAFLQGDASVVASHAADRLQLAAAALLVEAARMDGQVDPIERDTIAALLQKRFGLDGRAVADLVDRAEVAAERAVELHGFVREITDAFDADERVALVEMLWEVVYADGKLDPYEASLLRRIGGLLYVSDHDRGGARKRVLARLGLTEP